MSALGSEMLTNLATNVGAGVATGAMGGPIGMAVGGLAGVAKSVAPEIARWLGASDETIAATTAAVAAVTGQNDPDAALAALNGDPTMTATLRIQLADIASQQQAEENRALEARIELSNKDRQGARDMNRELEKDKSPMAWGAPLLSLVIVLLFAWTFRELMNGSTVVVNPANQAWINVLVTTVQNSFVAVVAYWIGSSAGSASKDKRLAAKGR